MVCDRWAKPALRLTINCKRLLEVGASAIAVSFAGNYVQSEDRGRRSRRKVDSINLLCSKGSANAFLGERTAFDISSLARSLVSRFFLVSEHLFLLFRSRFFFSALSKGRASFPASKALLEKNVAFPLSCCSTPAVRPSVAKDTFNSSGRIERQGGHRGNNRFSEAVSLESKS